MRCPSAPCVMRRTLATSGKQVGQVEQLELGKTDAPELGQRRRQHFDRAQLQRLHFVVVAVQARVGVAPPPAMRPPERCSTSAWKRLAARPLGVSSATTCENRIVRPGGAARASARREPADGGQPLQHAAAPEARKLLSSAAMLDMLRPDARRFHYRCHPRPNHRRLDFSLLQQTAPGTDTAQPARTVVVAGPAAAGAGVGGRHWCCTSARSKTTEEERRRATDGQWLEQSVRFHFRRLEDDLLVLARQAVLAQPPDDRPRDPAADHAGRAAVERTRRRPLAWLAAEHRTGNGLPARWQTDDQAAHPANAETLASMLDITAGLRRSAYAGPMRQADGTPATWSGWRCRSSSAGPVRGQLPGRPVAWTPACKGLVPTWFHQNHAVRLVIDGADTSRRRPRRPQRRTWRP